MQSHSRDFAIILAAGFSTRMGVCKTTLPWHNQQTLLRYQAEQFLQANITPIVVLGAHNAGRQSDCPVGSQVLIKAEGDRSKTSSILTGLDVLPPETSTITISAVDQPRAAHIYQTLLQAYRQEKALITAPYYRGRAGHPVLFSHRLLPDLKKISDSNLGLRKLMQELHSTIKRVAVATPEVFVDINDEETYRLLLKNDLKILQTQ
ncbi:MAG: nucleotidyltransferase family protein [Phormidesmis sp.]